MADHGGIYWSMSLEAVVGLTRLADHHSSTETWYGLQNPTFPHPELDLGASSIR